MQALTVKRVENVGYRERTRDGMRGRDGKWVARVEVKAVRCESGRVHAVSGG